MDPTKNVLQDGFVIHSNFCHGSPSLGTQTAWIGQRFWDILMTGKGVGPLSQNGFVSSHPDPSTAPPSPPNLPDRVLPEYPSHAGAKYAVELHPFQRGDAAGLLWSPLDNALVAGSKEGGYRFTNLKHQWNRCKKMGVWLPSGKHTKNYGKSPFLMGKSTINGHFQ